jgi:hypothetical protein
MDQLQASQKLIKKMKRKEISSFYFLFGIIWSLSLNTCLFLGYVYNANIETFHF